MATLVSEPSSLADIDLLAAARSAPSGIATRGRAYFGDGRARIEAYQDDHAIALVKGSRPQPYTVKILLDRRPSGRGVLVSCTCPYATDWPGQFCKHHVAALYALAVFLSKRPKKMDWRSTLQLALTERQSKKKTSSTRRLYFVVDDESGAWALEPQSLDLAEIGLEPDATSADIAKAVDLLGEPPFKPVMSYALGSTMARSPDESAALRILMDQRRMYYQIPNMGTVLPLLRGALVAVRTGSQRKLVNVDVAAQLGRPEIEIVAGDAGYRLARQVRLGDEVAPIDPAHTELISERPAWIYAGNRLFQIDESSELLSWFLHAPPVEVPEGDLGELLSSFILPLSERLTVVSDLLRACDRIEGDPAARIYLDEDHGDLTIRLRFAYGEVEAVFSSDYPAISRRYDPEQRGMVELIRNSAQERAWYEMLHKYGLKKGSEKDTLQLRQSVSPAEFLILKTPELIALGFELFGEESLTTVKVNRNRPKLSMSVISGIDWFDVQAVVTFGETSAALAEVRRAVRKGQNYVKLADGSMGHIPDDWLERYRRVLALAEETEGGLRLSRTQAALMDGILQESDQTRVDDGFRENRAKLQDSQVLATQPLPEGLQANLRPYQKHGFDWLCFLHDNRFGGCLADDMGIGKTLQALTLLQRLKESEQPTKASLVVAPRSVIENWHREAARFTPNLRVHLHTELDRTRDASDFDNFDLIVTTYGLMRRDAVMLAGYPFEVIILDESQAIKNAASDTARAARSLSATHRLALTGTPVENNTLELWSQFAFLNPGMLGSLEAFRREFAAPIEKHEDTQASEDLRELVRPFILRRTKEQVAPELPERTESVVYCEMDGAQRKLYDRTRDSYRAELLGLIEQQGINKARMRVLEGLLRLRQICNHPQLVDKTYHGVSAKLEALLEIVDTVTSEGHKTLVFSQFTQMLTVVKRELDRLQMPYVYLDGRTKNRQEIVDRFQQDESLPLFLISLKAGGVGLNLTAADYVIHIDPWWNPAVERQASDRTHRIGQTRPVFIQKLIARETVEEKMLELQQRKRDLVDKLISSEASFFRSLSTQDVESLFS